MKKFRLTICILTQFFISAKGLTHIVFEDDSDYGKIISKKVEVADDPFLEQLKDTLPDGKYIVYNTKRSNLKDSALYRFLVGNYRNRVKNGRFEVYNSQPTKKKRPIFVFAYSNGLLNGSSTKDLSYGDKENVVLRKR